LKEFKAKLKPYSEKFEEVYPYIEYDMYSFFGTEVTVIAEVGDSCVYIKEDNNEYFWLRDWFEKGEKE